MKGKIGKILIAIILIGCMIFVLISGIVELCNKENKSTLNIDAAGSAITVEHSINGIIPTGKEYYYYGFDLENENVYVIRAGKNWLEDNFDAEGYAKNDGFTVDTYTKKLDYDITRELSGDFSDLDPLIANKIDLNNFRDSLYVGVAIKKIISFVLILICVVSIIIVSKRKTYDAESKPSPILSGIIIVTGLVGCFLMIGALR